MIGGVSLLIVTNSDTPFEVSSLPIRAQRIKEGVKIMAKKDPSPWTSLALLTKIGFGMITPIMAGMLIGNYLDRRSSQGGRLYLILLTLLGALAAFRYLIVSSKRL